MKQYKKYYIIPAEPEILYPYTIENKMIMIKKEATFPKKMNKIIFGAAALALLALLKKNSKNTDDNPTITPAQKAQRTITFYKA